MAMWTTPPTAEAAIDKRIPAEHMQIAWENPQAIAEGAAGAPKNKFASTDFSDTAFSTDGTYTAVASSSGTVTTLIPAGGYMCVLEGSGGSHGMELKVSSVWQGNNVTSPLNKTAPFMIMSDGANVRIFATYVAATATTTLYYKRLW